MHEGKVTGTQQLISKVVKIKSFFFYIDVLWGNFIMDIECLECFKELQICWLIRMRKKKLNCMSFEVGYLDLEKVSTDFLHCLCGSY